MEISALMETADSIIARSKRLTEMMSNIIVRSVHVYRNRTPQEMLNATGCVQHIYIDIVETIPRAEGDKIDVVFFKSERNNMNDEELEQKYEPLELISADPYSLAAINEADPSFADRCPNCAHWKDENGKWCFIAFIRCGNKRVVGVGRSGGNWNNEWRFAGRRK